SNPDLETWLAVLVEHIRRRPGAILVGHSLGATLIAHLAAQHPGLNIGGALLVAPADPERSRSRLPGIASFAPLPLEPFAFPAILVASRTDPF
ncbi:RBBP9/YdeN family alpha/beta hydrolase, partial [Citrobacter koseri]|uniref:RBBP9/YdeN family alpha/beta hydrolase n=1 Tax=Citrobacter koseri TaxID=545 RepID=UPI0013D11490